MTDDRYISISHWGMFERQLLGLPYISNSTTIGGRIVKKLITEQEEELVGARQDATTDPDQAGFPRQRPTACPSVFSAPRVSAVECGRCHARFASDYAHVCPDTPGATRLPLEYVRDIGAEDIIVGGANPIPIIEFTQQEKDAMMILTNYSPSQASARREAKPITKITKELIEAEDKAVESVDNQPHWLFAHLYGDDGKLREADEVKRKFIS